MNAIILSIGDELVLGQTVDTNSAWLSQQLASIGCDVLAHRTVADDRAAIATAIREETARCDVLLISGGLGPTDDDLTRDALADALGQKLVLRNEWIEKLQSYFKKINRVMPDRNKVQAMIPEQGEILWNNNGTAPGIRVIHNNCQIFVMPGVPKEMKPMYAELIEPWIKKRSGGAVILQKTLHTFGIGESTVAEKLGDLMKRGRNPSVGTTVANGIVSLRVNARFDSLDQANAELKSTVDACYAALAEIIFGEDQNYLPQVVSALLKEKGKSVATAESCTGGLLAQILTGIPGSSQYFLQGWVTYTDESKIKMLGVQEETLQNHGAVSEETVNEMAAAAKRLAGSDYAISVSGIAGPDGGTADKPVGTVCIGFATPDGVVTRKFVFTGDREMIRDRSAKMALTMLRYHLLQLPSPF